MRRRISVVFFGILVLCTLMGCNRSSQGDLQDSTPTPDITITVTPIVDVTAPLTVVPSKMMELPIYTINEDLTELTTVTALIETEEAITEQVVTEAVVEALADKAIYVTVNGVSSENKIVTVDFSATAPPVSQVGAGIEGLILDAFGQSLLDNVADCDGISFTVDGGAYSSGHFEFGKDEIYVHR